MSSLTPTPDLFTLAQSINSLTNDIIQHLSNLDHSQPSFEVSSPDVPEDENYNVLRDQLSDSAYDILRLVNGPKGYLRRFLSTQDDLAAYQIAFDHSLFSQVPEHGSISLASLSQKMDLDEDTIGRVIRFLCTQRVFLEVTKNHFAHTASSILFVRDKDLLATAEYHLDEVFQAASETASGVRNGKIPFEQKHGESLFEFYGKRPEKAFRFSRAMVGVAKMDRQVSGLLEGYPWGSIGVGKVVDVGGGNGHVSMALAKTFPSLTMVVQDRDPRMLAQGKQLLTADLDGRIDFMQHNFFEPQPVEDADVFFIRQCLHNWSDEECITILRALVPAMEKSKRGTSLLINDTILPGYGTLSKFQEHGLRQMDMLMMILLGSKQRSEEDFRKLLHRADARYKIVRIHHGGTMGLLEVILTRGSE